MYSLYLPDVVIDVPEVGCEGVVEVGCVGINVVEVGCECINVVKAGFSGIGVVEGDCSDGVVGGVDSMARLVFLPGSTTNTVMFKFMRSESEHQMLQLIFCQPLLFTGIVTCIIPLVLLALT